MSDSWDRYVAEFHARAPGVTEQVLERATAAGHTPYTWLRRAVALDARRVLDLGCGSGPMAEQFRRDSARSHVERPLVVGVDIASEELARAASRGRCPVLCADATALPLGKDSFDAVVASMALMVARPVEAVLAECARVVRPGGLLAATLPSPRPLRMSDLSTLSQLTMRLRSTPRFPGGQLSDVTERMDVAGFSVVEEARERFVFTVGDRADADLLLRSLYLPRTSFRRQEQTAAWLGERAEQEGGVGIAIPIRRVVALRRGPGNEPVVHTSRAHHS